MNSEPITLIPLLSIAMTRSGMEIKTEAEINCIIGIGIENNGIVSSSSHAHYHSQHGVSHGTGIGILKGRGEVSRSSAFRLYILSLLPMLLMLISFSYSFPRVTALREFRSWSTRHSCKMAEDANYPFAYAKYAGQTFETKGRVNTEKTIHHQ